MAQYVVILVAARELTPAVRELVLKSKDGAALPSYGPGAHIEITVAQSDGTQTSHSYSLVGGTVTGDDPADTYRIAVDWTRLAQFAAEAGIDLDAELTRP